MHLDRQLCQGHGRCYALAPAVYEPDDDGHGLVASDPVPDFYHEAARLGSANCPEDAITVADD
ncbi:MAG: ferredoxin [Actinomycetota bacterium]|nr:ferredoxin [Actinomycetota bacterium]